VDSHEWMILVADAHRGDGKRFIIRAYSSGRAIPERTTEEEAQAKFIAPV